MAETSTSSLLQLLREEFDDEWEDLKDDVLVYCGEHCDGVATMRIYCLSEDQYQVEWELGWYEQKGEAETEKEVVRILRAMYAAHKTFNNMLICS